LDCGSGLRSLGKSLLREFDGQPIHAYIFLTHFHWDHIQGIPFFRPLYEPGNVFAFHAVHRGEQELIGAIEGQIISPYFPVDMTALGSTRNFFDRDFSPLDIQGAVITSAPLNHPQGCVGYRIEADGCVFVFATDTEPGSDLHDRAVRELARGADVLVYDAQYTPAQVAGEKKGWGHSSWLEGALIAREAGVKRLLLFHHDPDHDDNFVDGLVIRARDVFPNSGGATEGMEIFLPPRKEAEAESLSQTRLERRFRLQIPIKVAWTKKDGTAAESEGVARDISKSGIYFVVPEDVRTDAPMEIEVMIPDEITGKGILTFRFVAEAIRQESVPGWKGTDEEGTGVAARRVDPLEGVEDPLVPQTSSKD
jgi:phosphoribosyl 1,2-cyclic phosphodiesterase